MPCHTKLNIAVVLCLLLTFIVPVHTQEITKAYHQVSLPGFNLEYWSDLTMDSGGFIALGYKHNLVSSFIGYSTQERLLERARWEVFFRISFMHGTDFSGFSPGAYSGLGWSVSFENPGSVHRTILIPYTGFELGILTTTTSGSEGLHGSSAFVSSLLGGIHIYSSQIGRASCRERV